MKSLPTTTTLIGILSATAAFSQTTVTGELRDSLTQAPEPYATIGVARKAGQTPYTATISDENGRFVIRTEGAGEQTLVVSMVGRKTISRSIRVSGKEQTTDIGTLLTTADMQNLTDVDVVAQKPLVKVTAGAISYSVADDKQAETQTALDMLRKVPLVTVDGEDNISIAGQSSFKVYVDGKPNKMMSDNPTQAFRSMPASAIKNIEVITNPGAKYDAEGTSVVLSLTMVSKAAGAASTDGLSGNVRAEVGTKNIGGSLYLAGQKGKHSFSTNINASRYSTKDGESESMRTQDDGIRTYNKTLMEFRQPYGSGNIGYSFSIDTLRQLEVDYSISRFKIDFEDFGQTLTWRNDTVSQWYTTKTHNKTYYDNMNLSVGFLNRLKRVRDGKMQVSYQLSTSPSEVQQDLTYESQMEGLTLDIRDREAHTDTKWREHVVMGDYSMGIGSHVSASVGLKYTNQHNTSDNDDTNTAGTTTSNFKASYSVMAAYAEVEVQTGRLSGRAGLRYERTEQTRETDHEFSVDYDNCVPTAQATLMLTQQQNIGLSYNMRIRRPASWQMDPYVDKTDPTARSFGNANLDVAKPQSVKLSYNYFSAKTTLSLGLSHNFCSNGISQYSWLEDGMTYSTYGNIEDQRRTALEAYVGQMFSPKVRLILNGYVGYVDVRSKELGLSNNGWRARCYLSLQTTLPKEIEFSPSIYAMTSNVSLQSDGEGMAMVMFSLSRGFLQKRLNASLSGNMALDEDGYLHNSSTTNGIGYTTKTTTIWPMRSLSASVSFKFGNNNVKGRNRKLKQTEDESDEQRPQQSGPQM